ncbi:RNA polymerase, sigma-24 subunit, ECF subfamily [Clostridium sp. DL-VIII]|uniref:sigma-70 family RNA polymerase sigma factor n=1 Tax=Clostridium sp. DL-VIII TaxID=641107 RepID=UPI00023B0769|nr:sigma-70 family RNA polymerase sigma factor [Clostridium sp. DL-VIII]EHJ01600.1 RNA polymerase, sigma-24 subunit, ECF subfamily [Clostridium sp. DL-VIII]
MNPVTTINFLQKEKNIYNSMNEKEGFAEIFELYYKRLYNYTYYRVNSHEAAEDITIQVFEKVMIKFHTYINEKSKFEVWIFTIARNTINDYFRKQKRHKIISIDNIINLISRDKGPEDLMLKRERNNNLMDALSILDAKERNIVAYKFGANLKNVEIAKILKISESNVGVKLHRIMKKLKSEMEKEGK